MVDALFVDPATGIPYTELPVTDVATHTGLGTDGAAAPAITGTGVRGWLRGIYERLGGNLAVTGPLTDAQLRAAALPISGSVTVSDGAGPLTVDGTINVGNLPATQPVSGTVSVGNFPASTEIANDVGNPVPVSGTVTATGPLTDTQLRAAVVPVLDTAVRDRLPPTLTSTNELPVADDYDVFEALADQTGAAGVLTFTFTAAVSLVVVHAVGTTQVARATTTQTPTASLGARCPDDAPTYLPVITASVKVFAPAGMVVSVCGYRRS